MTREAHVTLKGPRRLSQLHELKHLISLIKFIRSKLSYLFPRVNGVIIRGTRALTCSVLVVERAAWIYRLPNYILRATLHSSLRRALCSACMYVCTAWSLVTCTASMVSCLLLFAQTFGLETPSLRARRTDSDGAVLCRMCTCLVFTLVAV